MKKIAIGGDHAGFELKEIMISYLQEKGFEMVDKGCFSLDSVDYPDFAHPTAEAVENKEVDFGILICGSANGVSMAANKHQGIRAAIAWLPEIASLAKQHNDANILSLPARFISVELAKEIVDAYINTDFEGGRHGRRVDKIAFS
jgi:ribose 5-phosphate isomerase B